MRTLNELEAEEARLWDELQLLEAPYAAKRNEWAQVRQECLRIQLRQELRREMESEVGQEKGAHL